MLKGHLSRHVNDVDEDDSWIIKGPVRRIAVRLNRTQLHEAIARGDARLPRDEPKSQHQHILPRDLDRRLMREATSRNAGSGALAKRRSAAPSAARDLVIGALDRSGCCVREDRHHAQRHLGVEARG
jgi:hypothetical protein